MAYYVIEFSPNCCFFLTPFCSIHDGIDVYCNVLRINNENGLWPKDSQVWVVRLDQSITAAIAACTVLLLLDAGHCWQKCLSAAVLHARFKYKPNINWFPHCKCTGSTPLVENRTAVLTRSSGSRWDRIICIQWFYNGGWRSCLLRSHTQRSPTELLKP